MLFSEVPERGFEGALRCIGGGKQGRRQKQ